MKRLLLLTVFVLTACGPSQEEKQQIATIACNVMAESTTMDGAMKIREVNQAREQIGASPFLNGSDEIQESLDYNLCELLVLNDPSYFDVLDSKRLQAEDKFNKFIRGYWWYSHLREIPDDVGEYYSDLLVANFTKDKLIINEYKVLPDYKLRDKHDYEEDEVIFEVSLFNDSQFEVFNAKEDRKMIFSLDSNAESIFIPHHDECAISRECKFTRAPNISAENLQGHYVDEPSYSEGENYGIYKYDESSWFSESFFLWDDRKEYEFWKDNAEFELINGFILKENWDDVKGIVHIVSIQEDIITFRDLYNATWSLGKVSDDVTLPDPPEGYKDISE